MELATLAIDDSSPRTPTPVQRAEPSSSLLRAALAGLLAVGLGACDEEDNEQPWDCYAGDAGQALPATNDAGNSDSTGRVDHSPADASVPATNDASSVSTNPDASAAQPDAAALGPITTKEVEGDRTLASLKTECAERGGYTQIHAACAGANNCKGFSYHSSKPGVLTEHTCASANGCTGLSCVELAKDSSRTGKEVYEDEELPVGGPASCLNCHAVWGEKNAAGEYPPPDANKFKVWVLPGSTRTAQNWLELSAEAQEAVVAFGRTNAMPDGTAQVSMRGYHQILSRGEIQRAIQHIRTLTPLVEEIKSPL
jgi:hypothetical protein